jgi:glucan phosphoethanolaminetransferase (alkaline phosphatase superfamily)
MPATSTFLLSIVDTNWNESTELLLSIKIPLIGLLMLWLLYFFVVFKKINNVYLIRSKKIRLYITGIFLLVFIVGYTFVYQRERRTMTNKKDAIKITNDYFWINIFHTYPYDLMIRTYQVYAIKNRINKGKKKLENFKFEAKKEDHLAEKEVYVFVIGETGRYYNYNINGYQRETSPLLSKTANLISYTDFFSEANITSSSLSLILTRASVMDYGRSCVEKSFVDAFKEAGFKTFWIANQGAGNSFVHRISKDTDSEYFATFDFEVSNNYDERLWIPLEEILAKNDEKVLIVLHTLGSHFRYNFRYPQQFEVFKPCLSGAFDYSLISAKNKTQFINTYDNSILYTDFFLANTIQKLDSLNCISMLIYVADHGENLFDTEDNIVLHGGSKYTEYDFHVPFFVWTSDKYNFQYPSKRENLLRNKDKKLNTENIFYSILDMANITFPEQELSKSIASDSLREDSIRYIINTNLEVRTGY